MRLSRWCIGGGGTSGNNCLEPSFVAMKPQVKRPHGVRDPVSGQCALPHDSYSPAGFEQLLFRASVPLSVVVELGLPEFRSGGRRCCVWAPRVPVPEAAMDEADRSKASKCEVGGSGQFCMESVPDPVRVQRAAERHLGLRIFCTDARHHPRAGRLVHDVCHERFGRSTPGFQRTTLPELVEAIKTPATALRANRGLVSAALAKQGCSPQRRSTRLMRARWRSIVLRPGVNPAAVGAVRAFCLGTKP